MDNRLFDKIKGFFKKNKGDKPASEDKKDFIPLGGELSPSNPPQFKTDEDRLQAMMQAQAQVELPASGTVGSICWSLSEDNVLTISPLEDAVDAVIEDYENPALRHPERNAPWLQDRRIFAISHLVIEEGVTAIGRNAFACCEFLRTVTLPDSLTSIGDAAFADCASLRSIALPSKVKAIPPVAFWRCLNLTDVSLPDNLERIGDYAFAACPALESLHIPDSVCFIGEKAFADSPLDSTSDSAGTDDSDYAEVDSYSDYANAEEDEANA